MSAESQASREYSVEEVRWLPKDRKIIIEVEGGLAFVLRQAPEGLMAQLLLNEVANQRAAALRDDVVPVTETLLNEPPAAAVSTSPVSGPATSSAAIQPAAQPTEAST